MRAPAATDGVAAWCRSHEQLCHVLERDELWGRGVCRIWLPESGQVLVVDADDLGPVVGDSVPPAGAIAYAATAARIADTLDQDVLLAPVQSSVIPLPHQLKALQRAVSGDRVRYLLADEVGLGKTIEAGLVLRELKLRGRVKRTLVVAPKSLVTQWVSEMRTHFDEEFRLLIPGEFDVYRRFAPDENLWRTWPQVVCPMDAVKPMDSRRGWTRQRVNEYNQDRFLDLVTAGWDLVIVDESHRLGGSTDTVARHRLGLGLAEAAPYLLLLSATPHQGKTDAFHRLLSLLDEKAFPDLNSVTRERVQQYVIRTEKRRAVDEHGQPLFKPRQTRLEPVHWQERHRDQQLLYEAVTEYVREGYNQAMREKKTHVAFLMILMQRLVTSSTRAIQTSLAKRLVVLEEPDEQLSLFPLITDEEWADLDGEEQREALLGVRWKALRNERQEVKLLLELAERTQSGGPDAKAEALLEWIYRLQQEEGDPQLKVLVFTEFVPTQEMLVEFLQDRGISVVTLNGSMDLDQRRRVQREFAETARVMVSTEAGGEGLNLQFCHVVVNYDMPWNPMRIEQRIGRVDRIGQTHGVRALNLALQDTVEHRVREVLEQKLAVILADFGVDKTSDVLDSGDAARLFEELYIESLLDPAKVEDRVAEVVARVGEQARDANVQSSLLANDEEPDPLLARQVVAHPLPYWTEKMTVSYLRAKGGEAQEHDGVWSLRWPTGESRDGIVFREADLPTGAQRLSLEDPLVRGLCENLPRFVDGQPIPHLRLAAVPETVQGLWSLWEIVLRTPDTRRRKILPLFVHDDGRVLGPTARRVWDALITDTPTPAGAEAAGDGVLQRLRTVAEAEGRELYHELRADHERRVQQEREKLEYAFAARRRALQRVGLAAVRSHRMVRLEAEEREQLAALAQSDSVVPELVPVIVIRVDGGV